MRGPCTCNSMQAPVTHGLRRLALCFTLGMLMDTQHFKVCFTLGTSILMAAQRYIVPGTPVWLT